MEETIVNVVRAFVEEILPVWLARKAQKALGARVTLKPAKESVTPRPAPRDMLEPHRRAPDHHLRASHVKRRPKLTLRIASPANVTLMALLRLTIRRRLIGGARWLSRLARREGLWAGRALYSPSRPQTRAMGQRSWRRRAGPERPAVRRPSV